MDLKQIKQFIEDNKENEEVASYLDTLSPKAEGVSQEDFDKIVSKYDELKTTYKTIEAEHEAVITERDDLLQYKPKEVTKEEQALLDKQQELWQREVSLTLQEKGLHQFKDIVSVNDEEGLQEAVQTLQDALKEYKVDNSYVPTDNNNTRNTYDDAKEKGDTQGMLKSMFGFK